MNSNANLSMTAMTNPLTSKLKLQLSEFGLHPSEWEWKHLFPKKKMVILENKSEPGLFIAGTYSSCSPKWTRLEWHL